MKEGKNYSRRPEKLEIWLFSMKSSQKGLLKLLSSQNLKTTRQRKQYLILKLRSVRG